MSSRQSSGSSSGGGGGGPGSSSSRNLYSPENMRNWKEFVEKSLVETSGFQGFSPPVDHPSAGSDSRIRNRLRSVHKAPVASSPGKPGGRGKRGVTAAMALGLVADGPPTSRSKTIYSSARKNIMKDSMLKSDSEVSVVFSCSSWLVLPVLSYSSWCLFWFVGLALHLYVFSWFPFFVDFLSPHECTIYCLVGSFVI